MFFQRIEKDLDDLSFKKIFGALQLEVCEAGQKLFNYGMENFFIIFNLQQGMSEKNSISSSKDQCISSFQLKKHFSQKKKVSSIQRERVYAKPLKSTISKEKKLNFQNS